MIVHDPELCGLSPDTACPQCRPRTVAYHRRQHHLGKLAELEERLVKAGIDVDDFADLLWMRLVPSIDEQVKKIMLETIQMAMKDMRIIGRIQMYGK